MLFLVNDILDFSQLESKSIILNYEDANIVQLTEYCFSILELKAKLKNLNLIVEFSPDFPRKVSTDPNRVS